MNSTIEKTISVVVCSLLLAALVFTASQPPTNDFIQFWTTAQLVERNPYSADRIMQVQRSVGWWKEFPMFMVTPPWTIPLILPLRMVSFDVAEILYVILALAAIVYCAVFAWLLYDGDQTRLHVPLTTTFLFLPTIYTLFSGQVFPILTLLGVLIFLKAQREGDDIRAGLSLVLMATKPQVMYLFWIVFLLWTVREQKWRLLTVGILGGAVLATVPLLYNPYVYHQYVQFWTEIPRLRNWSHNWNVPTLGRALALTYNTSWLEALPSAIGVTWAVVYWFTNKEEWNWQERMPLLLLVSVATPTFGWIHDQLVTLPAVMVAVMRRELFARALYLTLGLWGLLIVEPGELFWISPAFLVTYLLSKENRIHS